MSFPYKGISRKNPLKKEDPAMFYVSPVYRGSKNMRDTAEEISEISMVGPTEVMAVLEAMLHVVPKNLGNGFIINLGDFGIFRITVKSNGAATEKELNASNVKKYKVVFKPGKVFRQVLKNIHLEKDNK